MNGSLVLKRVRRVPLLAGLVGVAGPRRRAVGLLAATAGLLGLWATALTGSAAALPSGCLQSGITVTCTFSPPGGDQTTWTVPAGVTSATFDVRGAQGGTVTGLLPAGLGGLGGEAKADLALTPGATVTLVVGGEGGFVCNPGPNNGPSPGGFNGGGASPAIAPDAFVCPGAGGGGASDVRIGGSALSDRVLVAGGGGGEANCPGASSGDGGGLTGGDGTAPSSCLPGGGGAGGNQTGTSGSGQLGVGSDDAVLGGGGGGGYYGGAGGGRAVGGGGGGSFGPAGTTFQTGVQPGDGQVIISYTIPAATLAGQLVTDADHLGPGAAFGGQAMAIQAAVKLGDTATVCTDITDFLGLVESQTGKKLSSADSKLLTTDANNLAAALGC